MKPISYDVCIIGAGISGLGTAAFLHQERPELEVLVLEKAQQPGGAIGTYSEAGYLAEWGPHGFLDNCEESRTLISLAGLEKEVTTAPLGKFVRYVCLDGQLRCIPQQPLKILREPLIPWSAKLRVLADLWKKPLPGEPSVAEWTSHRFGKALLPFADAVFTGTYAGDIERLKIDAVMPGVRELEKEHGSVIRGVIGKMRRTSREQQGKKKGLPAMTSFSQGMTMLPQQLAAAIAGRGGLVCANGVQSLLPEKDGWRLQADQGTVFCRHLVLALPVNQSLELLTAALPDHPPPLPAIPESRLATVLLGFDDQARIPFGFGYLAPEQEQRFTLGALFSSHMFPGRAPAGCQLLEALVGGRRHPERLELPDEELIESVVRDLSQLMPLPKPPSFAKVLRPRSGIPQLEQGYTRLMAWRRELHTMGTNLHLCGFGWKGIGINDMTKEARQVARSICSQSASGENNEVKGVYF